MVAYELMVVLHPELEEEYLDATLERLQNIVKDGGGQISGVDKWGKRRLAYEVNKLREGFYTLINFKCSPEVATEVERIIKITDPIIRYLLIRDEHAKAEEVMEEVAEEAQEEAVEEVRED